MPIRWNALKVSESADRIEEYVTKAAEPLEQARLVAQEARKIPNLPGYIDDCFARLLFEIGRAIGGHQFEPTGRLKSTLSSIRERIPKQALEAEKKSSSHGSQQILTT